MDNKYLPLEKLIDQKIEEGVFQSVDQAIRIICGWVTTLEEKTVLEQMRSEDA